MASIDLICGALGAGKTTYIKKYTRFLAEKGLSFAVIENEFGEAGVDSAFLANEGIETSELSGGCICCTLKVGFHDELMRLSQCADRVIVEPSGIYDITTFFKVTDSGELRENADRGAVVCIVDPHSLDRLTPEELNLLTAQISASSCVVISKAEELDVSDINAVKRRILELTECESLNYINYDDYQAAMLSRSDGCSCDPDEDHSSLFQSAKIIPDRIYTVPEIECCVKKVFDDPICGKVIRIKGFVKGKDSYLAVNATKEYCEIYEVPYASCVLNVIGSQLSRKAIKNTLSE